MITESAGIEETGPAPIHGPLVRLLVPEIAEELEQGVQLDVQLSDGANTEAVVGDDILAMRVLENRHVLALQVRAIAIVTPYMTKCHQYTSHLIKRATLAKCRSEASVMSINGDENAVLHRLLPRPPARVTYATRMTLTAIMPASIRKVLLAALKRESHITYTVT
jgi:hypothetical protein